MLAAASRRGNSSKSMSRPRAAWCWSQSTSEHISAIMSAAPRATTATPHRTKSSRDVASALNVQVRTLLLRGGTSRPAWQNLGRNF